MERSQPNTNKVINIKYPITADISNSFAAPRILMRNFFMMSPPEKIPRATAGILMRPRGGETIALDSARRTRVPV